MLLPLKPLPTFVVSLFGGHCFAHGAATPSCVVAHERSVDGTPFRTLGILPPLDVNTFPTPPH